MNEIAIVPQPMKMTVKDGTFEIDTKTRILTSKEARPVGEYLSKMLGLSCTVKEIENGAQNAVLLTIVSDNVALGDEGYAFTVKESSIVIKAHKLAGLFYGVQTLRQLLPTEIEGNPKPPLSVPQVEIVDQPRFKWRGLHFDVGRHMFAVDFIKKFIDLMALQKMNTFHWHLTEDQGWRIEIKKYPKLTEIGSKREATPLLADRNTLDDTPYGGFYTQDEIRDVVAYAAERFITVVPEIELPGHSVSALASYPELGCTGGPYKVRTFWGVEKDVFCAGNENTYTFLEDVLDEVMELFPSEYIHIGGDECPKERWKECPKCQAMIEKQGLANEHELQSYFIKRMEKYLNSKGKRIIGWDEILEGGLAPNATVMSWRGINGGIQTAQQGNDVIMTPRETCYLNFYQSEDKANEPPAIGHFLPLERVYAFEPVPEELTPEEGTHVLGGQGNLWSEFIDSAELMEYMAYPRASAIAEALWSPEKSRDYEDFKKRLSVFLKRLDELDVNYRKLD